MNQFKANLRGLRQLLKRASFSAIDPALMWLIVGAPLMIGGVSIYSKIPLAILATLLFTWVGWQARRQGQPLAMGWLGMGLVLLLGWTFVQWLPIPTSLLGVIAPKAHDLQAAAAEVSGTPLGSWLPITWNRSLTGTAWLSLLATFATYVTTANLGGSFARRRLVLVIIQWAAIAVLVTGMFHALTGMERIFGLYEASVSRSNPMLMTSFVNPNHAAALMMLGALCSLGLAFPPEEQTPHMVHLVVWMALCVGTITTLSRANIVLLAAALLFMTGFLVIRYRRTNWGARPLKILLGTLAMVSVTILVMGPDIFFEEMAHLTSWSTFKEGVAGTCWSVGTSVVAANPLTGVGHGAFSAAATASMNAWDTGLVSFAHNLPIQAVADWGIPAAIVGGLCFCVGLGRLVVRSLKSATTTAVAVALVALVIQNMVDFSLFIPGVAIPAAAAAGWLTAATRREGELTGRWISTPRIRWNFGFSTLLMGLVFLMAYHALYWTSDRWATLMRAELALDRDNATLPIEDLAREHPGNFHLYHLSSLVEARREQPDRAREMADLAVKLAPTNRDVLLHRARLCLQAGELDQAISDLNQVASEDSSALHEANLVALRFRRVDGLVETYFQGHPQRVVRAARTLFEKGEFEAERDLLNWASVAHPDNVEVHEALTRHWKRATRFKSIDDPLFLKLDRWSIDLLVQGVSTQDPGRADQWKRVAYMSQGYVLSRRGERDKAFHAFLEAAALDRSRAAEPLIHAARELYMAKRFDRLGAMLSKVSEFPLHEPHLRAEHRFLKSHLTESRGDMEETMRLMRQALRYAEHNLEYRRRFADLLEARGDLTGAQVHRSRIRASTHQPNSTTSTTLDGSDTPGEAAPSVETPEQTGEVPGHTEPNVETTERTEPAVTP